MAEIEFVDRSRAEAEAARAIGLLNDSDTAKVEAWFALQAVADQIGPLSNVGVIGIHWAAEGVPGRRGKYLLRASCRDGHVVTSTGAPPTLEEAQEPENVAIAVTLLEQKVAELGGRIRTKRPRGTTNALLKAVGATAEGREWIDGTIHSGKILRAMVAVADTYGREGVNPRASLAVHEIFISFPNRAELVRQHPSHDAANAKRMSLLRQDLPEEKKEQLAAKAVSTRSVKQLALRSGVSAREARFILGAIAHGRSKRQLVRAVNLAADMVKAPQDELRKSLVA